MPRAKPKIDPSDEMELNIKLLCDQAANHMKCRNYSKALGGYCQALELNGNDINALISRSKCYLLLGEPGKALQDAETALNLEKNNIRAIYQKAESLYFLGQFENSLMFFHRGLRLRPELASFRLGVQKTQEAIENTIGTAPKPEIGKSTKNKNKSRSKSTSRMNPSLNLKPNRPKVTKVDFEKRNARKLLGELYIDKEYLENLLKHPDLKRADTNSENISMLAKDALEFLNNRQEFWRQQRTCTALPNQKNIPENVLPGWY
ncbi:tetratricopeptide repeat protein 25 isoform X2 [Hermetia illucens]|uniref:tetratricopeptide repeat protein 25 isoform X2 n=1 Tax=Hermetia illucens TaxID=343691 RepID=UPI0018CC1E0F|nr:tetratricopeptide repeat protein 25 isoform X2 [Hermetia illucens]